MGAVMSDVIPKDIKPLENGTTISIKIRIPSTAKRFSIDLVSPDESVAFHFSPRFDENPNVVVCNTWTPAWLWWKEDRVTTVPFSKGKSFDVTITVRNAFYEVSVNGQHFLNYDHRVPYHTVYKVKFRGHVYVEDFSYSSVKEPPPYSPPVNTSAM